MNEEEEKLFNKIQIGDYVRLKKKLDRGPPEIYNKYLGTVQKVTNIDYLQLDPEDEIIEICYIWWYMKDIEEYLTKEEYPEYYL